MAEEHLNMIHPINLEKALEEFDQDKNFLYKVVTDFVLSARSIITVIKEAIIKNNSKQVMMEAHSIKGGALNLYCNGLSRFATDLEDIGRSGNLATAYPVLHKIEQELERLSVFIEDFERE